MAAIQILILCPSGFLGVVGLLYGPDTVIPTPQEKWQDITVDVLIPTYNEQANILLCLHSILKQTLIPQRIVIIDDVSKDLTVDYAEMFSKLVDYNIKIISHEHNEGKTPSMNYMAHESTADVMCVVDGDTILQSNNYIERLVQELYQGVGIACACGIILPLTGDRRKLAIQQARSNKQIQGLLEKAVISPDSTWVQRFLRGITNVYREELYLFLQSLVYRGEMVFFGTIIFPIGCAVAYRRKYLKNVFDKYSELYGNDLTSSEDIFIGFSFADYGYRNIVVQDIYALSVEPRVNKVWKQIFKWSSSYFQSCYYFDHLVRTPFKFPRKLMHQLRKRFNYKEQQAIEEKRKIKEAYRQAFGSDFTKKYGRPIGWFVFTAAFEKISYPTILLILAILGFWKTMVLTMAAEIILYTLIVGIMHKSKRFQNMIKSLFVNSFMRYAQLIFDVLVIGNFVKDLWISGNRRWRK